MGGWRRVALLVAVVAGGVSVAVIVRSHLARLGPLEVTPAESRLSVRVGEAVDFTAAASGAAGYVWSVWGRAVSHDPTWRYVPAPEDSGWQQVTVTAIGRAGTRAVRTWDVGVVTSVPPALVDVTPPPGHVAVAPGETARFHCGARVSAARANDRVRFEWSLDGAPVSQEERPATSGASEFALPVGGPGSHSVTVRVSEDDRVSSLAEWTVEAAAPPPVAATPPETAPAVVAAAPPTTTVPPAPPPPAEVPPVRRLARAPSSWKVDGQVGEKLEFRSGLAPGAGQAAYDWKVDGRTVQKGGSADFTYTPLRPGTHRVIAAVRGEDGAVGVDAWRLEVAAPAPPAVVAAKEKPPVVAAAEPADRPAARRDGPAHDDAGSAERSAAPEVVARATPPPTEPATLPRAAEPPHEPAPPPAARPSEHAGGGIDEAEIRAWLDEYAHAWSRRDVAALARMGQIRSDGDAERLARYFDNVQELHVDVRLRSLRVEGDRAAVEFERIDTVTDPTGRRQQLRLPLQHKEIARVAGALRFVE